ncbi:MAG: hypothetical protein CMO55_27060 [Verrucomicrobiales bacterium]|nr:hypothetical protein [Verrucomicrobiales bacterium]
MSSNPQASKAFQRFTKVVVFFAILLIWWGAATTTKQAGMAFFDWPLSFGSVNPTGWLSNMVPFLEHSHRLLATLVGLLVLAMFSWSYIRSKKQFGEVVLLVLLLAVVFGVFIVAGAERTDVERKKTFLSAGVALGLLPVGWLIWSWMKRGWSLVQKFSALALLVVTVQAILGGLRVTEISNTFAVIHGCLAQGFFCLLILIVLAAGPRWSTFGFSGQGAKNALLSWGGVALVGLTSLQLIFGASMRHFHRFGLADTDLLKTQGKWIPSFEEPIIAVMFLHKYTGFCLFLFAIGFLLRLLAIRSHSMKRAKIHLSVIVGLLLGQVALGLMVIATGKHFWLTNFHVLNGLAILAVCFVFVVRAFRTSGVEEGLA